VHLVVGSTTFDVTSRALVIGVLDGDATGDGARQLVAAGADILEVPDQTRRDAVRAAAGVPVVGPGEVPGATTADEAAAVAVAIARGARVVRARDVSAARRVADVLAAVIEAGPPRR
jgi:hypothetical protein